MVTVREQKGKVGQAVQPGAGRGVVTLDWGMREVTEGVRGRAFRA